MNATHILIPVSVAYLAVAVSLCMDNKYWMAFVFLCYALSNLGLYMVAKQ